MSRGQEGGERGGSAAGRGEGKRSVAGGVIDVAGARNMDRRSLRGIFDDIDTKKRGYINVSICIMCVCVMLRLCVVCGEGGGVGGGGEACGS